MEQVFLAHRREAGEEGPREGPLDVDLRGDEAVEFDPLDRIGKIVEGIAEPGILLEAADKRFQRALDGSAPGVISEPGLRRFELGIDVVRGPPLVGEHSRILVAAANRLAFDEVEIVAKAGLAQQPNEIGARLAPEQRFFMLPIHGKPRLLRQAGIIADEALGKVEKAAGGRHPASLLGRARQQYFRDFFDLDFLDLDFLDLLFLLLLPPQEGGWGEQLRPRPPAP